MTKKEALQKFSFLGEIDKNILKNMTGELMKCLMSEDKSFIEALGVVAMS